MLEGQELQIALGKEIVISGFNDGQLRYANAYKVKDLGKLNAYLTLIDQKELFKNFIDMNKANALSLLLRDTFDCDNDNEFNVLIRAIDNNNYKEIIDDIKKINGIEEVGDDEISKRASAMKQKNRNGLDWEVSMAAVVKYTSSTFEDIGEMTFIQFKSLIDCISKDLALQQKLATIQLVKEPDKYLQDEDSPLYSKPKFDKNRVTTMKEIVGITSGN